MRHRGLRRLPSPWKRVAIVAAVVFVGGWLLFTGGRPWEFLPFGTLWRTGRWPTGYIIDTKAKEHLQEQLRTGDAEQRRSAVSALVSPTDTFPPDWETGIAALAHDPDPSVRGLAALGLMGVLYTHFDEAVVLPILEALTHAMVTDPAWEVRDTVAVDLAGAMDALRKKGQVGVYRVAVQVVLPRARVGTRDGNEKVGEECRELVKELEGGEGVK